MTIIKNTILLLKADTTDSGSEKYTKLLNNFQVKQVKTLEFIYNNLEELKEKLSNPNDFSGILLSSPRCINAVQQALPKETVEKLWKSKNNFVVGEATYKDAVEKLGLDCRGKETGNANNLSRLILEEKEKYMKPFLFPHGNLKTDTLKLELGRENLEIVGVLVYETIASTTIENDLSDVTNGFQNIPEFVIFFSPSGVHSSINYLRKIPTDLNQVKFIAIGPVTELAIKGESLPVYGVAKQPTPENLLEIITQ